MAARKTAPRSYHHGNLREALINAADALIASQGLSSVTLREVARGAGVSHTAPYHHFKDLDELLAAVAARSFVQLGAAMAKAAQAPDAREAVLGICEAYVAHACAHPVQFRLMFGPLLARKSAFPEYATAANAAFAALLQACERFAPGEATALALSGWSLAHGFSGLAIDGALQGLPVQVPADARAARQLADWLLARRQS